MALHVQMHFKYNVVVTNVNMDFTYLEHSKKKCNIISS